MFLPADGGFADEAPGLASARRGGRRPGRVGRLASAGPAIAIGALLFGGVLGFEAVFGQGVLFWPVVLGVAGIALLWRQADEAQRERWLDSAGRIDPFRAVFGNGGWAAYARVAVGLGLVVVALVVFGVTTGSVRFAGPDRRSPGCSASSASRWSSARGCCGWSTTSAPSAPSGSAPRSGPTWPPTCTTRCSRRSP